MFATQSRQGGARLRTALIIRSMIGPNGLPIKNFVLASHKHMTAWNNETGEVRTIKYSNGAKIKYVWYDEVGEVT